jgi:hypothetical protein
MNEIVRREQQRGKIEDAESTWKIVVKYAAEDTPGPHDEDMALDKGPHGSEGTAVRRYLHARENYFPVEFWPANEHGEYPPCQRPCVTWINVCICMYNENAHLLHLTLSKLAEDAAVVSLNKCIQFRVLLVADGWEKCADDTKDYLRATFSDATEVPWWTRVEASASTASASNPSTWLVQKPVGRWSMSGLHLSLAFKADNRGKVNSHMWFFNAFCRRYESTYTVSILFACLRDLVPASL